MKDFFRCNPVKSSGMKISTAQVQFFPTDPTFEFELGWFYFLKQNSTITKKRAHNPHTPPKIRKRTERPHSARSNKRSPEHFTKSLWWGPFRSRRFKLDKPCNPNQHWGGARSTGVSWRVRGLSQMLNYGCKSPIGARTIGLRNPRR